MAYEVKRKHALGVFLTPEPLISTYSHGDKSPVSTPLRDELQIRALDVTGVSKHGNVDIDYVIIRHRIFWPNPLIQMSWNQR